MDRRGGGGPLAPGPRGPQSRPGFMPGRGPGPDRSKSGQRLGESKLFRFAEVLFLTCAVPVDNSAVALIGERQLMISLSLAQNNFNYISIALK